MKNLTFNKIIFYLYSVLFLFTPFIMTSNTSELFEFNKMIFIYLMTSLILFFWLLKMVFTKKIIIKKTPFDIPIFLFLASQIISTVFSIDRHTSIFGYYGRFNGGLLSIITYIILFYGFISNFFESKSLENILKVSIFSSVITIFWGLPGKLGYDLSCLLFMGQLNNSCWTAQFKPHERMFSTLGQPNWLGAFLAINFFIGLYFYFKNFKNKRYLIFNTLYLLLNFSSILFTRSRSSLGATLFCLLLFFLLYPLFYRLFFSSQSNMVDFSAKNILAKIKPLIIIFFIVFLPILVFKTGVEKIDRYLAAKFYLNYLVKPNKSNIVNQIDKNEKNQNKAIKITASIDIRKIVWQGALELGNRYPFFGTGVETFAYAYYFVRPKEHNLTSEWDYLYNKAHNEYLNYLATTGYIGLISYLLMVLAVAYFFISKINFGYQKNQKNKDLKNKSFSDDRLVYLQNYLLITCLFLAYLTILITNFFGFSTSTINLFFYLIPAFFISIYYQAKDQEQPEFLSNLNIKQQFFLVILLIPFGYFLFAIFSYWYADVLYAKADYLGKAGEYQQAVNYLNQALKLKYEHVYEDKLSYLLANLAFAAAYQKQNKIAQQLIITSKFYNKKSLSASPKNVLYWKTKAKNYYLFYQINLDRNQLEEGINALKQAKILSPTDPKIPYTLAIFYSILNKEEKDKIKSQKLKDEAKKLIDEALFLKPDFQDAISLKKELEN